MKSIKNTNYNSTPRIIISHVLINNCHENLLQKTKIETKISQFLSIYRRVKKVEERDENHEHSSSSTSSRIS